MELVTPSIGLMFWTSLVFVILLFLLAKFAWKPILKSVKEREGKIESAFDWNDCCRYYYFLFCGHAVGVLNHTSQVRSMVSLRSYGIVSDVVCYSQ